MSNRGSSGSIALAVLWPFVLTGYRLQLARLPMKSNTKFWTGFSTGYMLLETIYNEQKSDWTRPHPVGFFSNACVENMKYHADRNLDKAQMMIFIPSLSI